MYCLLPDSVSVFALLSIIFFIFLLLYYSFVLLFSPSLILPLTLLFNPLILPFILPLTLLSSLLIGNSQGTVQMMNGEAGFFSNALYAGTYANICTYTAVCFLCCLLSVSAVSTVCCHPSMLPLFSLLTLSHPSYSPSSALTLTKWIPLFSHSLYSTLYSVL
jgi:hypothetical protein